MAEKPQKVPKTANTPHKIYHLKPFHQLGTKAPVYKGNVFHEIQQRGQDAQFMALVGKFRAAELVLTSSGRPDFGSRTPENFAARDRAYLKLQQYAVANPLKK